jgi:hypothetical protein
MGFVDLDWGLDQSRPEKRLLLLKLCSKGREPLAFSVLVFFFFFFNVAQELMQLMLLHASLKKETIES